MSNRNLLILTAVVLGLGAFIWFFERHQPKTDEKVSLAKKVFPDLEAEQVRALEVRSPAGDFSFVKQGGSWNMIAPLATEADSSAVEGVISGILELEKDRSMGPDEVEDTAYGLDAPEFMVSMTDLSGAVSTLHVGTETPLGSKRAVSTGGAEVILTSSWFTTSLDKELSDWRSRDLCRTFLDDLSALEVTSGEDHVNAVRSDGRWHLTDPVEDLADEVYLGKLVTSLNSLRIEEFTDGTVDPSSVGVTSPRYRVRLLPTDDQNPVELAFGELRHNDGKTTVACLRNGADLFWVGDGAETALGKAPVRWRAPKVHTFDSWDVQQLAISGPTGEVHLDRATGVWLFTDGSEADSEAVRERLTALADLEALEFDLMHLGTPELGRITLFRANDGDDTTEVVFFESLSAGGHVLAEVSGRNNLMAVSPEAAQGLLGNLEELRRPTETPTPGSSD